LKNVHDTAGITNEIEQFNLNIGLSCAQFVFVISGAMFVDKWGRGNMLMTSMFSISICWIGVVAATSAVAKDAANKSAGSAAVAMIFIFDIIFSFGITPMQALYPVEVLSFEMRAKGMALSSLAMNAAILINNLAIPVGKSIFFMQYGALCKVLSFTLCLWKPKFYFGRT
jgi:hypothetical protein